MKHSGTMIDQSILDPRRLLCLNITWNMTELKVWKPKTLKQPFLFTWKNRSLDRTFISVKLKQTPYLQTKKFHTKKGDTESQFIVLPHEKLGFNFKIKLSFENSSHYYFIPPHLTLALTASSLGQNGNNSFDAEAWRKKS